VRANSCLPGGCAGVPDFNNNPLASTISEYTGKHIVVIIAIHNFTGVNTLTAAQQAAVQSFWTNAANTYKNNPYVWFNVMNEPTQDGNLTNWYNDMQPSVAAIRATGAQNMIVLDGSAYGQDLYDFTCTGLPYQNSAIINRIPAMETQYGNILPSLHVYQDWGGGGSHCAQSQLDARLTTYVQKVRSIGLPLLFGETGDAVGCTPTSDTGNNSGSCPGTVAAFDVAAAQGIGLLYWHSSSGTSYRVTTNGGFYSINSMTNPTNLSTFTGFSIPGGGQSLWNLAHFGHP
jgi:mannan endo-1,4-beta-mannosidase